MLSAKAGTPLAEIEALVESKGQQLAFEPMDYGPMLGRRGRTRARSAVRSPPTSPVRGGSRPAPRAIISSASRRCPGRGETFKSGGRVVKNVTGYDLCKLMAGSWGTLAAMTEVTSRRCRVRKPRRPCWCSGSTTRRANEAMSAAMASSCDVSAAAHLPRSTW